MKTDFENSAIERMLQAGLPLAHIQQQKRIFFQDLAVENYYKPIEATEESDQVIPVPKILAVNSDLELAGTSVYDFFMGKTAGSDLAKSEEQLKALEERGLTSQQAAYGDRALAEALMPLNFHYYQEEDGYILQGAGVHQVVAAKMFAAPLIFGRVAVYQLDEEQQKLYEEFASLNEILRLTDLKGVTLDYFQANKKGKQNDLPE
ncbi:hypothetical protein ACWOCJ_05125 [Enterococcus pseudoavium]|uniref:hypothetical protein n=1 Tax=Enterococcus pseudoavium TaxID=44007 RepID=UPI00082B9493|nr:hypothetical protein [Enterococcus pseudoavium]